jgi:hypothetical protein
VSDHAAIVREGLHACGYGSGLTVAAQRECFAALDRLVAELTEAKREFVQIPTTAQILRAEAAEAEVARLNHENGKLEEEARALREALRGYMFGGSLDSLKAALGEDA